MSSACPNNKQNVCKDRFTFSHFLIYFSLPFQEGRINLNKRKKIDKISGIKNNNIST